MDSKDFTVTILVQHSPEEVYEALLNVRGWWSGLYEESFEGNSEKTGDEFTFVTESNLCFVDKTDEWTGTKICFEITEEGDKTKIVFTHIGLVPEFECYHSCSQGWTQYIVEKQLKFN